MDYVRSRLAWYGNDLISLGVDGLRLDEAKRMSSVEIDNQTVHHSGGETLASLIFLFLAAMQVRAAHSAFHRRFRYTTVLKNPFLKGGIASLQNVDNRGWIAGSGANVFVSNHDTERVRSFHWLCSIDDTSHKVVTLSTPTHLRTRTRWPLSSLCMLHCRCPVRSSFSQRILSICIQRSSLRHNFCLVELQQLL